MLRSLLSLFVIVFGAFPAAEQPILVPSALNHGRLEYDGVPVKVRGYLVSEPEASGLWDSKLDFGTADSSKCISINYPIDQARSIQLANRKEVTLEGTFRKNIMTKGRVYLGLCNVSGIRITGVQIEARQDGL
jgi:hypothetical protein